MFLPTRNNIRELAKDVASGVVLDERPSIRGMIHRQVLGELQEVGESVPCEKEVVSLAGVMAEAIMREVDLKLQERGVRLCRSCKRACADAGLGALEVDRTCADTGQDEQDPEQAPEADEGGELSEWERLQVMEDRLVSALDDLVRMAGEGVVGVGHPEGGRQLPAPPG